MNARLNSALILLDRALEEIETGFVACNTCGDQEDTKNLDFVDDLKTVKSELVELVKQEQEKPPMPKTVEYANKTNHEKSQYEMVCCASCREPNKAGNMWVINKGPHTRYVCNENCMSELYK